MVGISVMPGFWADCYMCWPGGEVETINRMLSLHASDFPNTCCGGFRIEESGGIVRIYPKVMRGDNKNRETETF